MFYYLADVICCVRYSNLNKVCVVMCGLCPTMSIGNTVNNVELSLLINLLRTRCEDVNE